MGLLDYVWGDTEDQKEARLAATPFKTKNRTCTDLGCLLLYMIALLGWIAVTIGRHVAAARCCRGSAPARPRPRRGLALLRADLGSLGGSRGRRGGGWVQSPGPESRHKHGDDAQEQ